MLAAGAAGFSPAQHQSKGLSAAAEYMACRATVGDLLQSINSHRTAALQPPAARTTATSPLVAAMAPAGDTVFSRDGSRSGCAAVQPMTDVLGSAAPGKVRSTVSEPAAQAGPVVMAAQCLTFSGDHIGFQGFIRQQAATHMPMPSNELQQLSCQQ